jgi:hypothetical protein
MDSQQQKDAATMHIFPPGVPLLTILTEVSLQRLCPINLSFAFPTPERYWIGGLIVAGAIFGLSM